MKVYGATREGIYAGGVILVAADSVEEAFATAALSKHTSWMFYWVDKDGFMTTPKGDGAKLSCPAYPFEKWKEIQHLSWEGDCPQVILEDSYAE